jgi:hypothetical protein
MDHRGISAIVAVILMVLISIAGVGILYMGILPMIKSGDVSSSKEAVSISTQGGYTLYDERQEIACVQVEKETDEELEGLRVLFSVEGNSHSAVVAAEDVPEPNQKRTYCFNLSNFGKPDTVTIVSLPERGNIAITSVIPLKPLSVEAIASISGGGGPSRLDDDPDAEDNLAMTLYYFDSDRDGFSNGSISVSFHRGRQPNNYTLNLGDCDDSLSSVNPNASEAANNAVDEDCNGRLGVSSCFEMRSSGTYELLGHVSIQQVNQIRFTMPDLDYPGYVTDRRVCLWINGSNVTLDLKGYSLKCLDVCDHGIYILNSQNSIVRNGSVGSNFTYGLVSYNSRNLSVDSIEIPRTRYGGVDLHFTNYSRFNRVNISSVPNIGWTVWKSSHNYYSGSTICGAGLWNVYCNLAENNTGSSNFIGSGHAFQCVNYNLGGQACIL